MIAFLVATLAGFGLWYVELKPSSSTSGGGSQGVGAYQSAINKAHQAVEDLEVPPTRGSAPRPRPAPRAETRRRPAKPTTATATASHAAKRAGQGATAPAKPPTSAAATPTRPRRRPRRPLSAAQR